MISTPKAILITSIRLMGDVILTTALIGLFKDAYTEATVDLLLKKASSTIRNENFSERVGRIHD